MGMSTARRSKGASGFSLVLMLAALLTWIAIPAGTMTSGGPRGPHLVICTGHGPLLLDHMPGAPAQKAPAGKAQPSCAFAGHGVAGPSPLLHATIQSPVAAAPGLLLARADLAPGRGLAAPPPPAQAPPSAI